ncbi:MAG: hypothetical protein KF782_10635 [Labilithrix sp.]|nr:hypothetical protein [Labilithrix sp.]
MIEVAGSCAPFSACGGSPQGTYDYTSGCVDDVFASAREQCPSLDTTNAKVTAVGSLYFKDGALSRRATVRISGTIVVPAACSAGRCAALADAYKSAFGSISCTGTADCVCTIESEESANSATTFTVTGNNVTTGDGETYAFCDEGDTLEYSGRSAGSEEGVWTLKRR